ncbi:tensin-3-like [Megalops cyprinoides]|uniref:tensin-3-like n=1 Tax=Megalops cyprinoides TaxID=118141 RepID=UPI001863FBA1|nr:tensin-3-like [Megalops cyprinoides]
MEEGYELDLTYVTERIIAVSFPRACSEETYQRNLQEVTRMLKSKHTNNYLVINLSGKRHDLTKMNPKTMDMGWPDLHAPPLDKICSICKAMENWLNADPQHVVVIHCRGGKGRIGVIISSFVNFTNISASAGEALDRFAMRKFYDDKVSALMTPSQKRYVWILNSLLTGSVKMNASPLFLHCVILHGIPDFDTGGACRPYLKVYQAMQVVYTSGTYQIGPGHRNRIYITLEPAQLLKGDIMLKCYHKGPHAASRELVFRLQFHTGTVQGYNLIFEKEDLETANRDSRFPDYGKIELVLSESPERIQGSDRWQNGPDITVDCEPAEPMTRWDSYQNLDSDEEGLPCTARTHTFPSARRLEARLWEASVSHGAENASLFLPPHALCPNVPSHRGKRRRAHHTCGERGVLHAQGSEDCGPHVKGRQKSLERAPAPVAVAGRTDHGDHTLSASSDSGLSSASAWTGRPSGTQRGPSRQEQADLKRLLSGFGLEGQAPCGGMSGDLAAGGLRRAAPGQLHVNGETGPRERETDILDDEVPVHDLHSVDSIGTLSSSEDRHFGGHKGSQNSLLSDEFGSQAGEEQHVASPPDPGAGPEEYERAFSVAKQMTVPIPRATQPLAFGQSGYSTQTWVRQQQMVAAEQYRYLSPEADARLSADKRDDHPRLPAVPDGPTRGSCSRDTLQRTGGALRKEPVGLGSTSREEEFAALTVDIDQSIDQLNQLIMDLDPTFVPLPTRSNSVKRDGGGHLAKSITPCTNGLGSRPVDINGTVMQKTHQSAIPPGDVRVERSHSLSRQGSDVTDCAGFRPPGWGLAEEFLNSPVYTPDLPPSQRGVLYRSDSLGYRGQVEELDGRVAAGSEMVPPTPAFPISPPTPYVKSLSEFPHTSGLPQASSQCGAYRTQLESRGYPEGISHAPVSSDGGLYRSGMSMTSSTCQRPPGPVRSMSTGGLRTESPSSGQSWVEGGVRTPLSRQSSLTGSVDSSRQSPPLPQPGPLGHSSPRGSQRGGGYGLSHCAGASFEDRDAPASALGNGVLEAGPGAQPPLPEKRRVSEGERSLSSLGSTSPSFSGFSSPHGGSNPSIPFPSVLPDAPSRALSTPSPLPDVLGCKQATVKFVQDTSKYWYKPDISRDQAIAVLKDKEPGCFIVRDSHSFRGAYGLAMKVATPPPSVLQSKKGGDLSNELVRHFLIECTPKGVRLKGCPNEPYFGSLTALVCQHSITPLALPCKLIIPDTDPLEDLRESPTLSSTNSAAELLKQGAACNVWYLGSMEMESLTGYQAIQKATSVTLSMDPPPTSTVVHFKVSAQGITLTDNQRKLFFRRHYAVNTVIFCALDPHERKWTRDTNSCAKIFGFIARKSGSARDNVCHLFAEHDPEQPASAIVNFVSKVMIGSQKSK